MCQLRESRLDIEESLTEEKKALETLKKELEALNKKCKVIESALVAATSELEAFQVNVLSLRKRSLKLRVFQEWSCLLSDPSTLPIPIDEGRHYIHLS